MSDDNRIQFTCPVEFQAAEPADDGKPRQRTFSMVAYTGGLMNVGFYKPIAIDLKGLQFKASGTPILEEHVRSARVGVTAKIAVAKNQLVVEGKLLSGSPSAQQIAADADAGFPFQASIGARILRRESVDAGASAEVNGQTVQGPAIIAREATLGEVSFVALGADSNTAAIVAAQKKEDAMNGDQNPSRVEPQPAAPEVKATAPSVNSDEIRAAERKRAADIALIAKDKPDIMAKAVSEGWSLEKTRAEVAESKLEDIQATRNQDVTVIVKKDAAPADATTFEAAMMLKTGAMTDADVEKKYGEKVIAAADKMRGVTLLGLFAAAAGWAGHQVDAIRANASDVIKAAASSQALTNLLGAVAYKSLRNGYQSAATTFNAICANANVANFHTYTRAMMAVGGSIAEIGEDGEFPHAQYSEETYTNGAKTYGITATVTRKDIVNDDLSALTRTPREFGRRMAIFKEKTYATALLANTGSFFASGNSNYASGSSSALSYTALKAALKLFREQTDANGEPIYTQPAILLVPPALEEVAKRLMASEMLLEAASAGSPTGERNIYQGLARVVVCPYLGTALSLTSSSDTGWYLLADPMDVPTVEMVHLNGVTMPVVESSDADFSTLGRKYRCYHDFGVALADYRGGVFSAGA